jgi:hypothetical protein
MQTRSDAAVAAIQAKQIGLATTRQVEDAGVSKGALGRAVSAGSLVRVRKSVVASPVVAPTFEQRVLAAVLSAGENAFASHAAAAQLWDLPLPAPAQLEITTILERRPRTAGVRMHRSGLLIERDITHLCGIPVTVPERTIVDLSSRLTLTALGRLTDDALRRRITSLARIVATAERLPRAPGRSVKKMRELLDRRVPGVEDRESKLEDFVFDSLRRFRLPMPVCQHEVIVKGKRRRIDCCYPAEMLALEALGFRYHGWRSRWDADALRGNELQLAGFRVLQFTSAFTDRRIAEQVAEALGRPLTAVNGPDLTFSDWLVARDENGFGRNGSRSAPEPSKHEGAVGRLA